MGKKLIVILLTFVLLCLIIYGVWSEVKPAVDSGNETALAANLTFNVTTTIIANESTTTTIGETTTTLLANLTNAPENETSKISGAIVKELTPHQQCLAKFIALKEDTVIFRYASWNSFSSEWEPVVEKLESLNYSVVKARVGDDASGSFNETEDFVKECFNGVYRPGAIPQFICAGSKDHFIGIEPDIYTLKGFADECRKK